MKKVLCKFLALTLALCCVLPFFTACNFKGNALRDRVGKMLTGRNYTIEMTTDSRTYLLKTDKDIVYWQVTQYEKTDYILMFFDEDSESIKIFERSGSEQPWSRSNAEPSEAVENTFYVLNLLQLFFYYPEMFAENDGTYTYKSNDETISVSKDGKGIKCICNSKDIGKVNMYVSSIGKTKIEIPAEIKDR